MYSRQKDYKKEYQECFDKQKQVFADMQDIKVEMQDAMNLTQMSNAPITGIKILFFSNFD